MSSPSRPADAAIRITIGPDHVARVDRVVRAVEQCMATWRRVVDLGAWPADPGGPFACPAGLVDDLVQALRRAGHAVEVRDDGDATPVAAAAYAGAEGPDYRFLEAVAGHPRGTIEVRDWQEMTVRVAQLAAAFPGAHVIAALATAAAARAARRALAALLGHPVGLVTRQVRKPGRRCTVCTRGSLSLVRTTGPAVLVIDGADGAAAATAPRPGGWPYARMYGAVYADEVCGRADELRRRALVGPVIFSQPGASRRATVVVVEAPPFARPPRWQGALQKKQLLVWHNRARNRLVAAVARAYAAGDPDELLRCGVVVGDHELAGPLGTVAVLVESTAHARALRSLLRGWVVCDKVPRPPSTGVDGSDPPDPPPGAGRIVTLTYAATAGLDADVVVRATGGTGDWLTGTWASRRAGAAPVVVDFLDSFHASAALDAVRRIDDYRSRGWPVCGPAAGSE